MENRINGHTRLFCLIGSPVGHSGSPAMYNYSFERTGIDAAYLAFNIPLEETEKAAADCAHSLRSHTPLAEKCFLAQRSRTKKQIRFYLRLRAQTLRGY